MFQERQDKDRNNSSSLTEEQLPLLLGPRSRRTANTNTSTNANTKTNTSSSTLISNLNSKFQTPYSEKEKGSSTSANASSYFHFSSIFGRRRNRRLNNNRNFNSRFIAQDNGYDESIENGGDEIDIGSSIYVEDNFSQINAAPANSNNSFFHPEATTKSFWSCLCCSNEDHLENNDLYYIDTYNDLSKQCCQFGTSEKDGVWFNSNDTSGFILSALVWVCIFYSGVTVTLLALFKNEPPLLAMIYCTICTLSLMSHAKTTLTDPGVVPESAVPTTIPYYFVDPTSSSSNNQNYSMCSRCQSFKPPFSHHCRICDRCISRMDHHCPWMNNCIGAGNLKHFILFLVYTWTASAFALLYFTWHYFFHDDFSQNLLPLVRIQTFFCLCALGFTSTMIMNVIYGIMTGIGTIDRLKKKAANTFYLADEEPILIKDVFGIGPWYTWLFPIDPVFEDYDRVVGFTTTQRLLREHHYD